MPSRDELIDTGWRQGVLLPADLPGEFTALAHYEPGSDYRLLVITQTCDLVNGSLEHEPYFEVLCLRRLYREPDGNYLAGRNSRRIEFRAFDDQSAWYALAHERHVIDRGCLDGIKPDPGLSNELRTLRVLTRWITKRYNRRAFPEAFEARVKPSRAIPRKFQQLEHVRVVYVKLDPTGEANSDTDYVLDIVLLLDHDKFESPEIHRQCSQHASELEIALNTCDGISVNEIRLEPTTGFTIEEVKTYYEWDYSYLSFRVAEGPAEPLLDQDPV